MEKYGGITIVTPGVFVEGLIVETMNGNTVAREYYKDEYNEPQVSSEYAIDIFTAAQNNTPIEQMKEISEQLGTDEFLIEEGVVDFIKELAKLSKQA